MSQKSKAAKAASAKAENTIISKVGPKQVAEHMPGKSFKPASSRKVKGTVRENSKQAQLIEMLKRSSGATIPQIMDATSWQQHSVRGFLSGTIKKKLGLKVISERAKDDVRIYRIKTA